MKNVFLNCHKFLCFLNKRQKQIFAVIILVYCLYLIKMLFRKCLPVEAAYSEWAISDWMINYQAGFVRRGLIGELLFQIYGMHPFHLRNAILLIALSAFIVLVVMLIRMFKRERWSVVLLFAPCLLVMTIPMHGLFWTRRDNLALIMCWAIFVMYNRYMRDNRYLALFCATLLSILHLLIHEASFFFTFPIVIVFFLVSVMRRMSCLRAVLFTSAVFAPVVVTMALVCMFKGSADMALVIWESWRPCMEAYPCGNVQEIGQGVEALSWDAAETFVMHFKSNWIAVFPGHLPSFITTSYKIIASYYLVTRINTMRYLVLPPRTCLRAIA